MKVRASLLTLVLVILPGASAAEQRLSDLLLQIQRLQQEMQKLRGQVEVQQHQIDTLKQQVQDQYLDLDGRLRGQGAAAPETTEAGNASAAGETRGSAPPAPATNDPNLGSPGTGQAPAPSEQEAYRVAFDLLKQRRYADAAKAFEDLLAAYPQGELTDNARYWLGETYYVQRDYAKSLAQLEGLLTQFPDSTKISGAMLKIGYIHYDQGDWPGARGTLQELIAKYPNATEARLAQSRLDQMTKEGR